MSTVPCWHPFHEMTLPLGFVWYEERLRMIVTYKPHKEHEVRLRLLKPVKGELPIGLAEKWQAYENAWENYHKKLPSELQTRSSRTHVESLRNAFIRAGSAVLPELMALHAVECGCPWTPENNNILAFAAKGEFRCARPFTR